MQNLQEKSKPQIVTVDFETYWASDFSLKSKDLNMSEYVLDDRFAVHMMGMKIDDGPVTVYRPHEISAALEQIDWNETALLAQNTAFDGFILSQWFDVQPKYYYDTLSMGRGAFSVAFPLGLDSLAQYCGFTGKPKKASLFKTKGLRELPDDLWDEVAAYCTDDVNETWNVFQYLLPTYPEKELDLINLTIEMFCNPVLQVDLDRVQAALEQEIGKKVSALFKANATAADLMSNERFGQLLQAAGVATPPTKISPLTGKLTFAFAKTDRWMMDNKDHPTIGPLIQARLAIRSTIGETRAERLLNVGDNPLPVMLNYCGAHTTRWSAGNKMNLQNLPRGGELRKAILAPPGYVICVADSAQIEARVLAWLAKHTELLNLFAAGSDVYRWMASRVYNLPVEQITPQLRFIGKVLVLALGYGMGPAKLQDTLAKSALGAEPLKISLWDAEKLVNGYRGLNRPITDFWDICKDFLPMIATGTPTMYPPIEIEKDAVILPSGLALHYPQMGVRTEKDKRGYTYISRGTPLHIYGGLLAENITQALARCIVADQMLEISRHYRVVTMTHDEVVCIAKESEAEECLNMMLTTMKTPPPWALTLPLNAEGGYSRNYSK